ncbi:MAG: beta-N-acetylhexosaminidase [Gammaproteobacteria bacterium]|nr:beta-N-acetylhexosaminidase [Gammaproteobacteria bacterium]
MALTGPLVIGISGLVLTEVESELLMHPLISGVILFSRNFQNPAQLSELCTSIHSLRQPALLITVDQEGGRVQRFRAPFTKLSAAGDIGKVYDANPIEGLELAEATGELMAMELRACGVDLSYAPVLDIDNGKSKVIGNRGFHKDPATVAKLASAYVKGMGQAGMKAVGKHYPGHGSVINDTHVESATDPRALADIEAQDLIPFSELSKSGIAGMMAAHVLYPEVDIHPAGFSKIWLQDILRQKLGFKGIIFSDDLGMMAAKQYGDIVGTVTAALHAGCDRVLLCNEPAAVAKVLANLVDNKSCASNDILEPSSKITYTWETLLENTRWHELQEKIKTYSKE